VFPFLELFVPQAWGMASGLPVRSSFERESYDSAIRIVTRDEILDAVRATVPTAGEVDFYAASRMSRQEQLAHQFAHVDEVVLSEAAEKAKAPEAAPVDAKPEGA
jgi:hypothetical protein